jgi:hypothetical protein
MFGTRLVRDILLHWFALRSLPKSYSVILVGSILALMWTHSSPSQAQQKGGAQDTPRDSASRNAPKGVNRYDIDVTPKPGLAREKPFKPYKNTYLFTAENDWFTPNIPVWNTVLGQFKDRPDLRYLEVGCYEGRSAVWMLENVLTEPSSALTCMDPFLEHFGGQIAKGRFVSNVRTAGGGDRLELIEGYSQVELRRLPLDSYDIIYIDGDHMASAVLEDAVLSWRLLKNGGLLIFDDYAWEHQREPPFRPLIAIDFFTEVFRPQVEVVHRDYQLILKKLN